MSTILNNVCENNQIWKSCIFLNFSPSRNICYIYNITFRYWVQIHAFEIFLYFHICTIAGKHLSASVKGPFLGWTQRSTFRSHGLNTKMQPDNSAWSERDTQSTGLCTSALLFPVKGCSLMHNEALKVTLAFKYLLRYMRHANRTWKLFFHSQVDVV